MPGVLRTLHHGDKIQVLGEIKSKTDLIVHIVRDFSNVCIKRYNEAIATQMLACPRMHFSSPIVKNEASWVEESRLSLTNDVSKDLFETSSEEEN